MNSHQEMTLMNIYPINDHRKRNAINSNAKINCMSNKHDALKKLKLKALAISIKRL